MRAIAILGRPVFVVCLSFLLLLAPRISRACDVYDGNLHIPQVIVGNTVFLNVVLTLASVQSVGAAVANPAAASFDFYDFHTGLLTLACVTVGPNTYSNVAVGVQSIVSVGGATALPTAPTLLAKFPLPPARVGEAYSTQLVDHVIPESTYTIGIDTLANGSLPTGMTIHFDGTLSGTPFATGAADINGFQVSHLFTFGVCATDTFSRNSTSPCPQVSVLVNPTRITTAVVGSGSVSASPAGNSCGANCYEGFASGANVTLTPTPASGWTFTGWSGACTGAGACVVSANGIKNVVATFAQAVTGSLKGTWVGPWNWTGTATNGCTAHDGGTMTLVFTQSGSAFTGSVNVTGVQTLDAGAGCSVFSTDPVAGSLSGSISGSVVTYSLEFEPGFNFSGTATLNGNTLISNSLVRQSSGGSGSFSLAPGAGDWFMHWNCNGDENCVSDFSPNGQPSGSIDEGPSFAFCTSAMSGLQLLVNLFGSTPATASCTQIP
jgi:hypothetical protein